MDILIVFCKTLILFEVNRRGFSSQTTTTLPAFQRNLCLQDAIQIHVELSNERCPYSLFEKDKTNCSIPCIGTLETTNTDYCINHGIDYMLLGQSNTIMHEEFFNFSKCIITTITIKCDFLFQKGSPIDLVGAVIGCSLGVVLTLFGALLMKSLLILVKATQVPSLKDNSSLSARSRTSNTYHTLAKIESIGKSTTLNHETSSDKLITSNHSSNGSRQFSEFSVKEDVQQRESGDSKTYFQLKQQTLA